MEQEYYDKAVFCFMNQQYDEALDLFSKILEYNSGLSDVWNYMGIIFGYKNNEERSMECHYNATKLDPFNPFAWYNAGLSCMHFNTFNEALKCFDKAIELDPVNFPNFYYQKGCLLCRMNQLDDSLYCFNKCIELESNVSVYWEAKGQVLKLLGNYLKAIECFNQVVQIDFENYDGWTVLGNMYLEIQDFKNAIKCYEKIIKKYPSYLAWNNIGISFHSLSKYKKAVMCFEKALLLKPDGYEALTNKGYSLYKLKNLKEAEYCYEQSFKINANYFYTNLNYGLLLTDICQNENAIQFLNKAIELNPTDYRGWNNRGNSFINLGMYEEALKDYDKALSLSPEIPGLWVNKCMALFSLLKYDEAKKCAIESVKLHPHNSDCWSCLGASYEYLKEYDKAIEYLDKAIEINPKNAESWNHRGICLRLLDNLNQALSSYRHACKLEPYNTRYLQNMVVTLCCIGNFQEVIDICNNAIEILSVESQRINQLQKHDGKYFIVISEKENRFVITNILNNKGYALLSLKRYDEAKDCFMSILDINKEAPYVLGNLGYVYYYNKNYEEAIKYCDMAITLQPNNVKFLNLKGMILVALHNDDDAIKYFLKAGNDLVQIVNRFDFNRRSSLFYNLLDADPFFVNVLGNKVKKIDINKYKKLYVHSLKIIGLLSVSEGEESLVAHYTSKSVSELLLFKNAVLRLCVIDSANDYTEGKALLQYLQSNKDLNSPFSELYKAFITCFTFSHDCLNQFRLYGKNKGKEATGISLVIRSDFFNIYLNRNIPFMFQDESGKTTQLEKLPLYRCIYVDPKTEYVVSVGKKDEGAIYADNLKKNVGCSEKALAAVKEYQKYIDSILFKVRNELKELKKEAEGLDQNIVQELLISLSLLCKNAAFKEEQECRIFRIEPLNNKEIQIDGGRMYINYKKIDNYVKAVYFGAKASGFKNFKSKLNIKDFGIDCYMSEHPFCG